MTLSFLFIPHYKQIIYSYMEFSKLNLIEVSFVCSNSSLQFLYSRNEETTILAYKNISSYLFTKGSNWLLERGREWARERERERERRRVGLLCLTAHGTHIRESVWNYFGLHIFLNHIETHISEPFFFCASRSGGCHSRWCPGRSPLSTRWLLSESLWIWLTAWLPCHYIRFWTPTHSPFSSQFTWFISAVLVYPKT